MMFQYHQYYIVKPALEDEEECMAWPLEVIQEHVLEHMTDPTIELGESIRDQKHIRAALKDKLFVENAETGERKIDLKVAAEVRAYTESISKLYKTSPESCIFFNARPTPLTLTPLLLVLTLVVRFPTSHRLL